MKLQDAFHYFVEITLIMMYIFQLGFCITTENILGGTASVVVILQSINIILLLIAVNNKE